MLLDATTHIGHFVLLFHNVLESAECDELVARLSLARWTQHAYTDPRAQTRVSHDDDLYITQAVPLSVVKRLNEIDETAFAEYAARVGVSEWSQVSVCSDARINKYPTNTRMRKHCDHITTLFDPSNSYRGAKGVPVLSAVGSLNDDYEGGQFVMWENQVIPFPKGSVLVFPSSFMFPHQVLPITKGERLSWVSWAW